MDTDSWLRRRIRMCIWKAWKLPKTRIKNLIRCGINKYDARRWGYVKGYWRVSGSPIMHLAASSQKLHQAGYHDDGFISRMASKIGTARTVVWEVGKCENRRQMPFVISIYLLPDSYIIIYKKSLEKCFSRDFNILEQLGECLGCLACIGYHLCNWLVAEILEGKELSGYKLMVVREACLQLHITHADG